ncbi:MAG: DUF1549 domain-containing protein, partial [Pirellula sp.]|nr:DUF1549 domain-containing protein [Pirellula sp.]
MLLRSAIGKVTRMNGGFAIALLLSLPSLAFADERPETTSSVDDQQTFPELHNPDNPIRQRFGEARLQLWSLQPISRPSVPSVKLEAWVWNPIDAFLLSQWENSEQIPAPDSKDRDWLRRLKLHLTGLTLNTSDVEDYERGNPLLRDTEQIDKWLNSPRYGEHWARMWLDVVRYSDSNGFDWDEFRPNAWKFRNYIVQAFNRDKPFDRFVLEQIAGDELAADAPKPSGAPTTEADLVAQSEPLIASGYLRLGPYDNAAKLFQEEDRARAEWMADLTETTASAFLGLTMGCCRCHDHKTDPLSHADHYRLKAFFAACQIDDSQKDTLTVRESVEKVDSTRV